MLRRPTTAARPTLFALVLVTGVPAALPAQPPRPKGEALVWRTDYNAARKEAAEKGLPLLIEVGTDECFYCRKLESVTFRDPAVAAMLAGDFIPLKVDANREPRLAQALKVQVYPTVVLAGADGKIHAFIEGYLEPARMAEHMKRTVTSATTTDYAARDFNEASKALAAGDYARAVSLLKGVSKDAGEKPVGAKAREVLAGVERQAAGQLARAKAQEANGHPLDAADTLAEVVRVYAGTQAAADAAGLMAGLTDRPELQQRQRQRRARDLLAAAKEEFRTQRFYDCLQKCEQLEGTFADMPEGKEAAALAAEVKNHPERLAVACEQMNERTAAMYLALADSWMKKGQDREAMACLEKVMKLSPTSRHAELAQVHLTKLQGREPATPTGFQKKP
jgi:thioredoxin-related protein